MKYIYINEEGNAGVSYFQPTPEDLRAISDGRLEVLRVEFDDGDLEIYRVDENGDLEDPNEAKQDDDDEGNFFHYVET